MSCIEGFLLLSIFSLFVDLALLFLDENMPLRFRFHCWLDDMAVFDCCSDVIERVGCEDVLEGNAQVMA